MTVHFAERFADVEKVVFDRRSNDIH